MVSELSTLIHNLVLDNPVPAKDLAKAIGKPYSTLLREVNPYDTGAKLGAETLLQIMMQTGDTKPLEYMAGKLGYSPGCRQKRRSARDSRSLSRSLCGNVRFRPCHGRASGGRKGTQSLSLTIILYEHDAATGGGGSRGSVSRFCCMSSAEMQDDGFHETTWRKGAAA